MENLKYDINEEIENVIEEVSQNYGYDEELKKVLSKITKAIIEGKSYEDKQKFFNLLRTTPIVVLDPKEKITEEELNAKMFGNANSHIKDKETFDKGVYGSQSINGGGAFISTAVLDENLNITGVKKYIYVSKFDTSGEIQPSQRRFFNTFRTGISVHHLIHELGHAFASEENPYSMEDGVLTQRMGACSNKYKFTSLGDGTYECEQIERSGLFLEEGLNTNFEEETLAKYLGLSLQDTLKLYGNILSSSLYQPRISNMTRMLGEIGIKDDLDKWRLTGDEKAYERANRPFQKANFYEKRDKLYRRIHEDFGDSNTEIIPARNHFFNHPEKEKEKEILAQIEKDFFPDTADMTPMDMMDNILNQYYDIGANKYNFSIERYSKMLNIIQAEGGALINQARPFVNIEKEAKKEEQK